MHGWTIGLVCSTVRVSGRSKIHPTESGRVCTPDFILEHPRFEPFQILA